jgi:LysM repeat protein
MALYTMGTRDYTIKSGDTLAAVATLAHVSLDSVLHANPGIKPEALHPGQVIKLPVEENKPSGTPVQQWLCYRAYSRCHWWQ